MTQLTNIIFLLQFLIYLGIFAYKGFNMFKSKENLRMDIIIGTFVAGCFIYGIGIVTLLIGFEEQIIVQLFKLQAWMFPFLIMMSIVEAFRTVGQKNGAVKPYFANERK